MARLKSLNSIRSLAYLHSEVVFVRLDGDCDGDEVHIELFDDETREVKSMNAMSTSEGKQLLQLLEDAVEKLSKFVNTTRVPAQTALAPSDKPKSPPKF